MGTISRLSVYWLVKMEVDADLREVREAIDRSNATFDRALRAKDAPLRDLANETLNCLVNRRRHILARVDRVERLLWPENYSTCE